MNVPLCYGISFAPGVEFLLLSAVFALATPRTSAGWISAILTGLGAELAAA